MLMEKLRKVSKKEINATGPGTFTTQPKTKSLVTGTNKTLAMGKKLAITTIFAMTLTMECINLLYLMAIQWNKTISMASNTDRARSFIVMEEFTKASSRIICAMEPGTFTSQLKMESQATGTSRTTKRDEKLAIVTISALTLPMEFIHPLNLMVLLWKELMKAARNKVSS